MTAADENLEIIKSYIEAYNCFDTEGMAKLLHEEVIFRNFTNGEMNTETKGIKEFRQLAVQSASLFSSRRQTVTSTRAIDSKVEVEIEYEAVIAHDLPNGLKSGDKLQLKGKSLFEIREGKLSLIEDYS